MKGVFSFQLTSTQHVLQGLGMLCAWAVLNQGGTGAGVSDLPLLCLPMPFLSACPHLVPLLAALLTRVTGSSVHSTKEMFLPGTLKAKKPHHLAVVRRREDDMLQPQADALVPPHVFLGDRYVWSSRTPLLRAVYPLVGLRLVKLCCCPCSCSSSVSALNSLAAC